MYIYNHIYSYTKQVNTQCRGGRYPDWLHLYLLEVFKRYLQESRYNFIEHHYYNDRTNCQASVTRCLCAQGLHPYNSKNRPM